MRGDSNSVSVLLAEPFVLCSPGGGGGRPLIFSAERASLIF
jgi:hypothetical protein